MPEKFEKLEFSYFYIRFNNKDRFFSTKVEIFVRLACCYLCLFQKQIIKHEQPSQKIGNALMKISDL